MFTGWPKHSWAAVGALITGASFMFIGRLLADVIGIVLVLCGGIALIALCLNREATGDNQKRRRRRQIALASVLSVAMLAFAIVETTLHAVSLFGSGTPRPDAKLKFLQFSAHGFNANQPVYVSIQFTVDGAAPFGLETRNWATIVASAEGEIVRDPAGMAEKLWAEHLENTRRFPSRRVMAPPGPVLTSTIEGPHLTAEQAAGLKKADKSAVLFVMLTFQWSEQNGEWHQDFCFFTYGQSDMLPLCPQNNGIRR
jgi:hypothetical protein